MEGPPLSVIETLIQVQGRIKGKPFCCGVVAWNGRVVETAAILRRHIKKCFTGKQVADICKTHGWTWVKVHDVIRLDINSKGTAVSPSGET